MSYGKSGLLCLCLGTAILLSGMPGGCTSALQRGTTEDGTAYVSTARPAIEVGVADLPLVTHGRGKGTLKDPGILGGLSPDTWISVYSRGPKGPCAVIAHSELDGWIWTTVWPRPGAVDARQEIIGGIPFAASTYVQQVRSDPFAGTAGEDISDKAQEKCPQYWLVRYMAAVLGHRDEKLILEYRVPLPEGGLPQGGLTEAFLAQFRQEALSAFTIREPGRDRKIQDGYAEGIRWRFVDDAFLGPVMPAGLQE